MASSESRILEIFSAVVSPSSLPARTRAAFATLPEPLAAAFVRSVYRELKNNPTGPGTLTSLAEGAHVSDAPLTSWVTEILRTYKWLEDRGRWAKLADTIDYVSCAVEGSALQQGHSVEWYLTNYGFERSEPLRAE